MIRCQRIKLHIRWGRAPRNRMIQCRVKVNRQEGDNTASRPFDREHTTTKISSSQGTGMAKRTPTTTDEIARERILDLTTISQRALITTGLRISTKGLLNVGMLDTNFHRALYPLFHVLRRAFLRLRSRVVACGGGGSGLLIATSR